MGTDIHPAVEVRRNGVWRYHTPKTICPYYYDYEFDRVTGQRITRLDADGSPIRSKWDRCKYRLPEFFSERNYRVFAVLGDVRNGSGFAGVYTHDYIPPIQSQRGFPDGMDHRTRAKMSDEHSEGWVTLDELQAYDYDQMFTEGGVLNEAEYLRTAITGELPQSWSGGISGPDIRIISPEDYAKLYDSPISLLTEKDRDKHRNINYDRKARYHIAHKWERKLRDQVSAIPDEMVPYLEKLIPKGGTPEDVRLVFDFDS